ncbi:MAG: MAPEG family protein [Spirochaetales bacterium]|nr:MAPEG family protein [Leptospiraceae bacterium]MCP5483044.1 MAPEG family protein [Spirochaetales bacterium]MCP5486149.1 MAPEG family protein [Spirochaetales bacterium]
MNLPGPVPLSLLLFLFWTLLLALITVSYRGLLVFSGQKRIHEFPADQPHGKDWYRRLMRAHLNCLENLPVFATLILLGLFMNRTQHFEQFVLLIPAFRVVQSTTHVISGGPIAVTIRFSFYFLQIAMLVWIGLGLLGLVGY